MPQLVMVIEWHYFHQHNKMVENVDVGESLGSSDHNTTEFSVIKKVRYKESVSYFRWASFQAFTDLFLSD